MARRALSVLFYVAFIIGAMLLCDAFIFDGLKPYWHYIAQAIGLGILLPITFHLEDKGWNSWKKVWSLFKKKK